MNKSLMPYLLGAVLFGLIGTGLLQAEGTTDTSGSAPIQTTPADQSIDQSGASSSQTSVPVKSEKKHKKKKHMKKEAKKPADTSATQQKL